MPDLPNTLATTSSRNYQDCVNGIEKITRGHDRYQRDFRCFQQLSGCCCCVTIEQRVFSFRIPSHNSQCLFARDCSGLKLVFGRIEFAVATPLSGWRPPTKLLLPHALVILNERSEDSIARNSSRSDQQDTIELTLLSHDLIYGQAIVSSRLLFYEVRRINNY